MIELFLNFNTKKMRRLLYISIALLLFNLSSYATTISGVMSVCAGMTTTLTIDTFGGTWTSGTPTIATVAPGTGVVTGVSSGWAVISYELPDTTFTTSVLVKTQPIPITGVAVMCAGQYNTLISNPIVGGFWTSSNTDVATVVSNGKVTGVSGGTATITYSASAGCYVTYDVTINPVPEVIVSDSGNICQGQTLTLSTTPVGGMWSSSNPSVASIDATSGVVTAVEAGLTNVYAVNMTYTMPTGCLRTTQIRLNPQPGPIVGDLNLCLGIKTTFTSGPAKGKWSSSNSAVASIISTGKKTARVNSLSLGTTEISYKNDSGCMTTVVVTVVPYTSDCPVAVRNVISGDASLINAYPNPSEGTFVLQTPGNGKIAISTIDGRIIKEMTISKTKTTVTLPEGSPTGLYLCRFSGIDGYELVIKIDHQRH
jgi:hypothetical protein